MASNNPYTNSGHYGHYSQTNTYRQNVQQPPQPPQQQQPQPKPAYQNPPVTSQGYQPPYYASSRYAGQEPSLASRERGNWQETYPGHGSSSGATQSTTHLPTLGTTVSTYGRSSPYPSASYATSGQDRDVTGAAQAASTTGYAPLTTANGPQYATTNAGQATARDSRSYGTILPHPATAGRTQAAAAAVQPHASAAPHYTTLGPAQSATVSARDPGNTGPSPANATNAFTSSVASNRNDGSAPLPSVTAPAAAQGDLEAEMKSTLAKMAALQSQAPGLHARLLAEHFKGSGATVAGTGQNVSAPSHTQNRSSEATSGSTASRPPSVPLVQPNQQPVSRSQTPATPYTATSQPPPRQAAMQPAGGRHQAHSKEKAPSQPAPNKSKPPMAQPPPNNSRPPMAQLPPNQSKPPMAQPPPSSAKQQTWWPPEKRGRLAKAAVNYLKSQNDNCPTETTVYNMLHSNPSFPDLCTQLGQMKLKLDAKTFATQLLKAVPDAITPSRPAVRDPPKIADAAKTHVKEVILKEPANKEEAARKRSFNDVVDLTQLSDEDSMPPPKRMSLQTPISAVPRQAPAAPQAQARHDDGGSKLRLTHVVEPIEKKHALRRSSYAVTTIARDVLLASGRHPGERPLNGHLDILKTTLPLPKLDNTADLSTLRWDILDPGQPPKGYFKEQVIDVDADADDELDSDGDDEDEDADVSRTTAEPSSFNPFAPPNKPSRPAHNSSPAAASMIEKKSSVPPSTGASVGYSAFRSAAFGPDGTPLPKKKGRPVGWRKAIHGSAAAQASSSPGESRKHAAKAAASVVAKPSTPRYPVFKCEWQGCNAQLHNLATLRKHVSKLHHKQRPECLWSDCGREVASVDPTTGFRVERHMPFMFSDDAKWREHLETRHFVPISWQLGDGPASGVSDTNESSSEAHLSDKQGRRPAPRVVISTMVQKDAASKNGSVAPGS